MPKLLSVVEGILRDLLGGEPRAAVLVVEPSGDICGWSEVAYQMTGVTAAHAFGHDLGWLFGDDAAARAAMSAGFLLDTSEVSWHLDRHASARHPSLVNWLDDLIPREGLCLSAVSLYELKRGVEGLLRQGQGSRKAARIEMLLREATILGPAGAFCSGGLPSAVRSWRHASF